jgi:hypothetical protein
MWTPRALLHETSFLRADITGTVRVCVAASFYNGNQYVLRSDPS